jgi:hypothetical protein
VTDKSGEGIADTASLAKVVQNIQTFEVLAGIVSFFERLGLKNQAISEAMSEIPQIARQVREIAAIPDKFNTLFLEHGWIAHESMDVETAKRAIELADRGNIVEAENVLVEHYDEERIRFILLTLRAVEQFLPRKHLAELAMEDYLAGRYHASVPVVLMMIDGLVNDIANVGLFAQDVDVTAWDSVAGHSTGLTQLAKILGKKRTKTTSEEINIPFRNGILHGRDLGYHNKKVAAKSWAALAAAKDWAIAVKKQKTQGTEPEAKTGFLEAIVRFADTQNEIKRHNSHLESWLPRGVSPGIDVPETGSPVDFLDDSPEKALVEFLTFWSKRNYGRMAQMIAGAPQRSGNKAAGEIRARFEKSSLTAFRIIKIDDQAAAITEMTVELTIEESGKTNVVTKTVRLIHQTPDERPVARGYGIGRWWIMPMSIYSINLTL